jgi:hypothetical protein
MGDDQAVEKAADLGSCQREGAYVAGMVPRIGGAAGAATAQAMTNARASMARVMCRCQPARVRTW